jgi:hypothetical protein
VIFALIAFLSATAVAAPGVAGVSARDYEDFESCYGSVEGAAGVLPALRQQMSADDFAAVEHAMNNLTDDLADLEMRLAKTVFGTDRNASSFGRTNSVAAAAEPVPGILVAQCADVGGLLCNDQALKRSSPLWILKPRAAFPDRASRVYVLAILPTPPTEIP